MARVLCAPTPIYCIFWEQTAARVPALLKSTVALNRAKLDWIATARAYRGRGRANHSRCTATRHDDHRLNRGRGTQHHLGSFVTGRGGHFIRPTLVIPVSDTVPAPWGLSCPREIQAEGHGPRGR